MPANFNDFELFKQLKTKNNILFVSYLNMHKCFVELAGKSS